MAYQSHFLIVAMDMFAVLSHNVNKNKKERGIKGNSMKWVKIRWWLHFVISKPLKETRENVVYNINIINQF